MQGLRSANLPHTQIWTELNEELGSKDTPMRQIRNPRYGTEFLERKLSPSSLAPVPVAAQVQVIPVVASTDCPPTFPPYDPTLPPVPGNPAPYPPTPAPGGPSEPCIV
jgi:hypothetical protein